MSVRVRIGAAALTLAAWGLASGIGPPPAMAAPPPTVSGEPLSMTEGAQFSGEVATFTDGEDPSNPGACTPAASYTTGIDWGDGGTGGATVTNTGGPKASVCSYSVSGQHTFAEEGTAKVTVTVTNNNNPVKGQTGSATSTATIADAALAATGADVSPPSASAFTGTVASFTDADPGGAPPDYAVTIAWGDGQSSSGTVSANGKGGFDVGGTHTYAKPGSFTITTTVADAGGASAKTTGTANVAGPAAAPFGISNQTPDTGQHVVFDISRFAGQHGGVADARMDLNGDGVYERDLGREPRVGISYRVAGTYSTGLQLDFRDGGHASYTGVVQVSGSPAGTCTGVYCNVDFPATIHNGSTPRCVGSITVGVADVFTLDAAGCLTGTAPTFTTDEPVRVNGLDLFPNPGAHLTFDSSANTIIATGSVRVQAGEIVLADGPLDWEGLDGSALSDGSGNETTVPVPFGTLSVLEGFPISGHGAVRLRRGASGVGVGFVDGAVNVPEAFGDFSAGVTLAVVPDHGFALDGFSFDLPAGAMLHGAIPLKHLSFAYSASDDRWAGGLQVTIGQYDLSANFAIQHGALTALGGEVSGINTSLFAGIFLDAIRAQVMLDPRSHDVTQFGGGITLTYGPEVLHVALIAVDANFSFLVGPPADLALDGELRVVSVKIATAHFDYRFDGVANFGATVRIPWSDDPRPPNPGISASVTGLIDGPHGTFSIQGRGDVCLGLCAGASVVASNLGVGACIRLDPFGSLGGGYTFADRVFHFPIGCDLRAYGGSAASVHAAANDVVVPPGQRVFGIRVHGRDAPPKITLTGPHGEVVQATPGTNYAKTDRFWLYENPSDNTTGIALMAPAAGVWRITTQPGSPPMSGVQTAGALPPVKVSARVGGRGLKRTLSYRVRQIPGQQVIFIEQGKGAGRVIGRAAGSQGTLRFTPADGPAGRRTISAQVLENGSAREQLVVASYAAAPARPPAKVRGLRLSRARGGVTVSWAGVAGATRYDVIVSTFNHRRVLLVGGARARRAFAPAILPTDSARVTVTAADVNGRRGPTASASLRAGKAPRARKRRKVRRPTHR